MDYAVLQQQEPNQVVLEKEKEEVERQKQRSRNWGYHCQIPDTEVDEQSKLTEAAKLMSAEEMQRPYVDEGISNPLNICMLDNIKEQQNTGRKLSKPREELVRHER